MNSRESGQVAVLGVMITLVLTLLIIAGADLYRVFEIRDWAYREAEGAARYGASVARQWALASVAVQVAAPPAAGSECSCPVKLNQAQQQGAAEAAATQFEAALSLRGLQSEPRAEVVNLSVAQIPGFPSTPRRLSSTQGTTFQEKYPAVALAGQIDVPTFLGSIVGRPYIPVTYWGAAAVYQPAQGAGGVAGLGKVCPVELCP